MALHRIPVDGTTHLNRDCPCQPDPRKRVTRGVARIVIVHRERLAVTAEQDGGRP